MWIQLRFSGIFQLFSIKENPWKPYKIEKIWPYGFFSNWIAWIKKQLIPNKIISSSYFKIQHNKRSHNLVLELFPNTFSAIILHIFYLHTFLLIICGVSAGVSVIKYLKDLEAILRGLRGLILHPFRIFFWKWSKVNNSQQMWTPSTVYK